MRQCWIDAFVFLISDPFDHILLHFIYHLANLNDIILSLEAQIVSPDCRLSQSCPHSPNFFLKRAHNPIFLTTKVQHIFDEFIDFIPTQYHRIWL